MVRFAAIACLALGCSGTRGAVFQPLGARREAISARRATVHVTDLRKQTVATLDVPLVTDVGMGADASLVLQANLGEVLSERVQRALDGRGELLHFEVEVVEATAGWRANGWTEEERASVKLRVEARDPVAGRAFAACTGESAGASWSIDTSEERILALERRAFVNAFDRCLSDDFIRAVNGALAGSVL